MNKKQLKKLKQEIRDLHFEKGLSVYAIGISINKKQNLDWIDKNYKEFFMLKRGISNLIRSFLGYNTWEDYKK